MTQNEYDEIVQCIDIKDKIFYYYRDKYAADLLKRFIGPGMNMSDIKTSPYGYLLQKPAIKNIVSKMTGKKLLPEHFDSYWPSYLMAFRLSVGFWVSEWVSRSHNRNQTSRPGTNLVLRLDFANSHEKEYQHLIRPVNEKEGLFDFDCHPVNEENARTLAWARIDIDFNTGEALIEEIQNDWIRNVNYYYENISRYCIKGVKERSASWIFKASNTTYSRYCRYYEKVLQPYERVWDEAVLSAAIHFIRNELGIKRIFFHTWETGNRLKNIWRNSRPPQSIYSRLPKRFGFKQGNLAPKILTDAVDDLSLYGHQSQFFFTELK